MAVGLLTLPVVVACQVLKCLQSDRPVVGARPFQHHPASILHPPLVPHRPPRKSTAKQVAKKQGQGDEDSCVADRESEGSENRSFSHLKCKCLFCSPDRKSVV